MSAELSTRSIRLKADYTPLPRTQGVCAGVGTMASIVVALPQPVGRHRIFNPRGRIDLVYVTDRTERLATADGHNFLAADPAVSYRFRRDPQAEILVVGKTLRPRRADAEVQLDESPDRAPAVASRHGRCLVTRLLPARVWAEQPELSEAGKHQLVSVVLRDGRRYEGLQTARIHLEEDDGSSGVVHRALARRGCAQ